MMALLSDNLLLQFSTPEGKKKKKKTDQSITPIQLQPKPQTQDVRLRQLSFV